jgi:hypothetical protein
VGRDCAPGARRRADRGGHQGRDARGTGEHDGAHAPRPGAHGRFAGQLLPQHRGQQQHHRDQPRQREGRTRPRHGGRHQDGRCGRPGSAQPGQRERPQHGDGTRGQQQPQTRPVHGPGGVRRRQQPRHQRTQDRDDAEQGNRQRDRVPSPDGHRGHRDRGSQQRRGQHAEDDREDAEAGSGPPGPGDQRQPEGQPHGAQQTGPERRQRGHGRPAHDEQGEGARHRPRPHADPARRHDRRPQQHGDGDHGQLPGGPQHPRVPVERAAQPGVRLELPLPHQIGEAGGRPPRGQPEHTAESPVDQLRLARRRPQGERRQRHPDDREDPERGDGQLRDRGAPSWTAVGGGGGARRSADRRLRLPGSRPRAGPPEGRFDLRRARPGGDRTPARHRPARGQRRGAFREVPPPGVPGHRKRCRLTARWLRQQLRTSDPRPAGAVPGSRRRVPMRVVRTGGANWFSDTSSS